MIKSVSHILTQVPAISLTDLNAVTFDSRIDTKFVFHQDRLSDFLRIIKDDLVVLEVGAKRVFQYDNLYCDSTDFYFFKRHHSGFGNRSKVRVRKYGDTGPYFFEVKNKSNKGLTAKYRIPLQDFANFQTEETKEVLKRETGFEFSDLMKETRISYSRMTLANTSLTEKLTIDFEMEARSNSTSHAFHNLVVVEVKQIKFSNRSPFIMALKDLKIYPTSFSKYCSSVAMLNTELKRNNFLPIIKNVNKIARA